MILDDIVARRKVQLEREMSGTPLEKVMACAADAPKTGSFKSAILCGGLSVIAEVKKASPSKGLICPDFKPVETAEAYERAGADAVSVLTEEFYFKGSPEYLKRIGRAVSVPVLCKDFVVSPYQIYAAKALGAAAVLLIAAVLGREKLREYAGTARSIGLECLMEAHNEKELEEVLEAGGEIIGINNRDLKTFNVDLSVTKRLAVHIPPGKAIISESGIKTPADAAAARSYGADAVLVGETLMRSRNVTETMKHLRENL